MPGVVQSQTPGLASFLKSLKHNSVDHSIAQFESLLKRRQIRTSKPCAVATVHLLMRVVADFKARDVPQLVAHVRSVGARLASAQPRELVVGNIVRRVLGLIREVTEAESADNSPAMSDAGSSFQGSPQRPELLSSISTFSPLKGIGIAPSDLVQTSTPQEPARRPTLVTSYTSFATPTAPSAGSLFGIFSSLEVNSQPSTPPAGRSPIIGSKALSMSMKELNVNQALRDAKPEILEGMREILDELESAAEQIAAYAVDHIHSNEIIMVRGYSTTVQKFLITAAKKRKFTLLHVEPRSTGVAAKWWDNAEADPKDHLKDLTALGCTIVMIPDSHVSVIMPRVNKVVMAPYTVLSNGGLIAPSGAAPMAAAAQMWKVPVVALSGIYKLSPVFPYHVETFMEEGGAGNLGGTERDWKDVDIRNPLWDYVRPENVNLYVTSIGSHPPSYLYRIIADHYSPADINLWGDI